MGRIWDCFTFWRELDVLELRLTHLAEHVHRFVLVEATRTHSGAPKPLHFSENRERFARWHDQIVHVVVDDLEVSSDRWVPENQQRRAILRGLGHAAPDDVAIVSDVDEVPDASAIGTIAAISEPAVLEMRMYQLRANWLRPLVWPWPRACPVGLLDDPQALRTVLEPDVHLRDVGAHITFLEDERAIAEKLRAYAHAELDDERHRALAHLRSCVDHAVAPFDGTLLDVIPRAELGEVERTALALHPEWFSWPTLPSPTRRRTFSRYVRARSHLPWPVVDLLDARFNEYAPILRPPLAASAGFERAVNAARWHLANRRRERSRS